MAIVGSLVLPRSVVIKLEDAKMRLQMAVRVLLVLRAALRHSRYSDPNWSGICGIFLYWRPGIGIYRNSFPVWWG